MLIIHHLLDFIISTNGLQRGLITHGRYRREVYIAISPLDIPIFVNIITEMVFTIKYGMPSAKYSVGIQPHGFMLVLLMLYSFSKAVPG